MSEIVFLPKLLALLQGDTHAVSPDMRQLWQAIAQETDVIDASVSWHSLPDDGLSLNAEPFSALDFVESKNLKYDPEALQTAGLSPRSIRQLVMDFLAIVLPIGLSLTMISFSWACIATRFWLNVKCPAGSEDVSVQMCASALLGHLIIGNLMTGLGLFQPAADGLKFLFKEENHRIC